MRCFDPSRTRPRPLRLLSPPRESSRKPTAWRNIDLPDRGVRPGPRPGYDRAESCRNPAIRRGTLPKARVVRGGHMRRGVVKATLALGAIAAVGAGLALTGAGAAPPSGPQGPIVTRLPHVTPAVFRGSVRDLPQIGLTKQERPKPRAWERNDLVPVSPKTALPGAVEPQQLPVTARRARPSRRRRRAFVGLDSANWGAGWPPDTNGDVGPDALHPGRQHVDRHLQQERRRAPGGVHVRLALVERAHGNRVRQRQRGRPDGDVRPDRRPLDRRRLRVWRASARRRSTSASPSRGRAIR